MSAAILAAEGAKIGAGAGSAGGPLGAAAGAVVGALLGAAIGYFGTKAVVAMMSEAEDGAQEELGEDDKDTDCTQCDRVKELEEEADVDQQTKGKTKHGEKSGGFEQTEKDFDSLNPSNVKPIDTRYGPGRYGELSDGRTVVSRPGSSDGRPTLEIRNPSNGRGTEIRYNP